MGRYAFRKVTEGWWEKGWGKCGGRGERVDKWRSTDAGGPAEPQREQGEDAAQQSLFEGTLWGASLARDWRAGVQNCCE